MFGPRCILCNKRNGDKLKEISWVEEHGHYKSNIKIKGWYYHPFCLSMTLHSPKTYGHNRVDIALEIVERRKDALNEKRMDMIYAAQYELKRRSYIKAACEDLDKLER